MPARKGDKPPQQMAHLVELCSTGVGTIDGKVCLVLCFRPDPKKWASQSYAITKAQAERLREDLNFIMESSPLMSKQPARRKRK